MRPIEIALAKTHTVQIDIYFGSSRKERRSLHLNIFAAFHVLVHRLWHAIRVCAVRRVLSRPRAADDEAEDL